MKTINISKQIDLLFYRWLSSHKDKNKIVLDKFRFLFKNNNIKILHIKRNNLKIYAFEEFYTDNRKKVYNLLKKFNNYFQVINYTDNEIIIFFDGRLFKIYFKKKIPKEIKSINRFLVSYYRIKFIYRSNVFFSFISSFFNRIFFNNYKELNFKEFKEIELKYNYLDSYVRNQNLDLITNYKKNLKIKHILNFFKSKKNKNKISKKIFFKKEIFFKSLDYKIPIYLNLDYWNSSNFYLISNIIYGFYKKNFQYEVQSEKYNFYKVFINKKIRSIKNESHIKKIVSNGDLVIINNNPYSSRNRVLAMLGHILNGGKYIKIKYKSNFDTDLYKQRLINFFSEYYSIYKYSKGQIFNLDSNYKKVFEDREITLDFNDDYASFFKNRKVYFYHKKKYKKFEFIEIDNILHLPKVFIIVLFYRNKKFKFFYLDHYRNSKLFSRKQNIRHMLKILITILKLKLKILFVIEHD